MKTNRILLALLFAGMCLLPTTAIHADELVGDELTGNQMADIPATLDIPSSYSVLIPQSIEIEQEQKGINENPGMVHADFDISVRGIIKANKVLDIKYNEKMDLRNLDIHGYSVEEVDVIQNGFINVPDESFAGVNVIKFKSEFDGLEFSDYNILDLDKYTSIPFSIDGTITKAGSYTGLMNFEISVNTDPLG